MRGPISSCSPTSGAVSLFLKQPAVRSMSGNTLGKLYCVTSFGESHGPAIGCVVDGCPPGLELSESDIQPDLDLRKPGTSRHVTQRREEDTVEIGRASCRERV